ncbi:hypothetical protein [Tabrizicola sp.]|uniref:hypothetical protein n=1 Tax=Tabrizicola sp. TaxID=2005166 RepID=UPI003F33671A
MLNNTAPLRTQFPHVPAKMQTQKREIQDHLHLIAGELEMKKITILVPAAIAGVLFSAMVLAAPVSPKADGSAPGVPNRAEACMLATSS